MLIGLHCSKCGVDGPAARHSPGAYSYTCSTCGQVTNYTLTDPPDLPYCDCPICSKHFHDPSWGIDVDFKQKLLAYFAVVV